MQKTQHSFYERTPAPTWLRVFGIVAFAFAAALVILVMFNTAPIFRSVGPTISVIVGFCVLVFAGTIGVKSAIELAIDSAGVRIRFAPIWTRQIARADIATVQTEQIGATSYGGLGLRSTPHHRALLFSAGAAIAIRRESDGVTFHVRTNNPEGAAAALASTH